MKYFIHISANIIKEIQGVKKQNKNIKGQNTHPKPSSLDAVHIVQVKPFNTLNYHLYQYISFSH